MAMPREFYIPKNAKEIKDVNTDAVAYVEDWEDGTKYTAMVFAGKRSKYDKYYGFKTAERRDEYVKEYFEDIAASYESKKEYAEKKKAMATENQEKYKVGDVLVSSWGYDQTNIDFYQIVKKTKSMVTIQKIGKEYLDTKFASEELVKPVKNAFIGKEIKKKVGAYGVSLNTYADASLWDGQPQYQTAYGWGH
jgi:hypothetical protein|tara:strand:+ start:463 stop:1041 length:579 start_codon:yes stop_codon:yes gene_type:complete